MLILCNGIQPAINDCETGYTHIFVILRYSVLGLSRPISFLSFPSFSFEESKQYGERGVMETLVLV